MKNIVRLGLGTFIIGMLAYSVIDLTSSTFVADFFIQGSGGTPGTRFPPG